jgi:hypothetical protein
VKVGFDYWQVLSHYPERLKPLVDALLLAGHCVYVLSAVGKNRAGTVSDEAIKLGFDVPVYEVVFDDASQAPELKLKKCQELGIEMFFDDREDVCRLLNRHEILALRVMRKDQDGDTSDLVAERA